MSFYATGDQQVRLRFSQYTEEIIENDMFLFGETKRNTFINKIIRNYYPDAKASIHMRLEEYRNTLSEAIPSGRSKEDSHGAVHDVLKAFIDYEEKRLLALAGSYEVLDKSGKSKPYRLQDPDGSVCYSALLNRIFLWDRSGKQFEIYRFL